MSRNQALLKVLNSDAFLKNKDAAAVLRSLLEAGTESAAFSKAFQAEKSFFNGLIPGVVTDNDDENTIAVEGEGADNQKETNSISALRQKMIELLVIPELPKAHSSYLQQIAGPLGWNDILDTENANRFFGEIPDFKQLLGNEKTNEKIINAANEILSQRYYLNEIQKQNDEHHLIQIATKNNLNELKQVLPEDKTNDKVHLNAVSEKIAPALREAAATEVLRAKIATCNKPEALTQLAAAKNLQELKVVLENHAELGFKDSTDAHKAVDLRNALFSNETLEVIKALATVFQRITTLDKATIEQGRYGDALYHGFQSELVKKVFTKKTHDSINQAVLYHYLRSNCSDPNIFTDQDLQAINNGNFDKLNFANDIYEQNEAVQNQLKGIAAAAYLVRQAQADTKDYQTLLEDVNNPNKEPLRNYQENIKNLAPDAIHDFELERFLILINKAKSQQITNLTRLNDATTINDFTSMLDTIGLDKVKDWIRPDDLDKVKQAIANRLPQLVNQQLAETIESVSPFSKDSHPALLNLLARLPVTKREAVLADRQKIAALMHARNKNQIDLLLGTVSTALVQPLIDENTKLEPYRRIANAEIARQLALVPRPTPLNDLQIERINQAIINPVRIDQAMIDQAMIDQAMIEGGFNTANALKNFIDRISSTGFKISKLLKQFGIQDNAFVNNEKAALLEKIKTQDEFNENVKRYPSTQNNQYILSRLLGAKKSGLLNNVEIQQIIDDITNFRKATDILNHTSTRSYLSKFPDNGIHFFTDDLLAADKNLKLKANLESNYRYDQSLLQIKEPIEQAYTVFTRLSKADSKIRKKSEELVRYDRSKLFDPALGHLLVDGNTTDLTHLREWAANCERIIQQELGLQAMIEDAITVLDSVYVSNQRSDQARAIRDERKDLAKKLEKVKQNVVLYQDTIKLLNGDPDKTDSNLQKGLIGFYEAQSQTLTREKKSRQLIYFSDDFKDYPIAEKDQHMKSPLDSTQKPVASVQPNMTIGMDPQSQKTAYHIANPIAPGHFREHSVRSAQGKEVGRVIEERDVSDLEPIKGTKEKESLTYVRVSAKGFSAQANDEAAIRLAMRQAQIILENLPDNYPSKNSPPIVITGNAAQARLMWTALMILIEDRKLKIPASHITMNPNCSFDPATQYTLGRTSLGFNKGSAYKQILKDNPALIDEYKLPVKNLETEKGNASKFFKGVLSASKENQVAKNEIDTIMTNPSRP